jgi:hypothetical protein
MSTESIRNLESSLYDTQSPYRYRLLYLGEKIRMYKHHKSRSKLFKIFSFVSGGLMSYYLKVLYDYGLMSVENVTSFPEFYVYPSSFFLLFVGLAIIHHKRTKEFEKSLKNDEEIGSQNFEYNMHYVEELYKKLISSGTLQDYQLIKKNIRRHVIKEV